MNTWEQQYLDLVRTVYETGEDRTDRTGVGTRSSFAHRLDINLDAGFPLTTTKKTAWKSIATELLFFLEGSSDERRLAELLHGTRDEAKTTIWTENAQADYWKPKARFEGDLGRVYGVQWRSWRTYARDYNSEILSASGTPLYYETEGVDQLDDAIHKLKTNPTDRRMLVSAWNPGELSQMALPPCHMFFQLYLDKQKRLSLMMHQRSVDVMLGLPFNIASYALLTHLIAQVVGATPYRLVMDLGDTHIYSNHLHAVPEQLSRTPLAPPKLQLSSEVTNIDDFRLTDIKLVDYVSHDPIKLKMAV